MKLLLENWRKYLAERATDQAFADTVDFLVDTFTDPKNFEFASEEEEAEYMGDLDDLDGLDLMALLQDLGVPPDAVDAAGGPSDAAKKLFGEPGDKKPIEGTTTWEFFQVEPRMDDNWDRFVAQHPDAVEKLGLDENKMHFFIILKVVYGYPPSTTKGNDEDFDEKSDLTTAGYFNGEELVINLKANRFDVSEEDYRKLDEGDILNLLSQNADIIRMVVDHEFTHMLNYLRAGKAHTRAKGLKRHHYHRPKEMQKAIRYANSTEEIQARLIPIFKIVQAVGSMDQDKIPQSDVNEVAKLINIEAANFSGNKSLSNIIKLLYQMYELHHPNFLKWTSKSHKKRITKRFYEFAEDLISK